MTWALAILARLPWKWIAATLAALGLLYAAYSWAYARGAASRDAQVAALTQTIDNLKAASAKAAADNHAFVERINAQQAQITKDRNDEAPKLLTAGSSAIDAWVRAHPAPSPRLPYEAGTILLSDPAGQLDAALGQTVVPRADLDACNDAWVTATGLQGWLRDQAAIDRKETKK